MIEVLFGNRYKPEPITTNRQPQTINDKLNYYWNNLHYWLTANEQVLPG